MMVNIILLVTIADDIKLILIVESMVTKMVVDDHKMRVDLIITLTITISYT